VKPRLKQIQQDGATAGQKPVWDGGQWSPALQDNLSAVTAPTVNDDNTAGYEVGSVWIDTTSVIRKVYVCTDASTGAAVWEDVTNMERVEWGVTQAAHGFVVGDVVFISGGVWAKAQSNIFMTNFVPGSTVMVSEVLGVNTFKVCRAGRVNWPAHGKTVGATYYLSNGVPGATVATPPINWLLPVFVPTDANNVQVCIGRETPVRIGGDTKAGGIYTDVPLGNSTIWLECLSIRISPNGGDLVFNTLEYLGDPTYPVLKQVTNISGQYYVTFKQDDGVTGTAAYRILNESGVDLILPPQSSCWIWYDIASSRWRTFGATVRRDLTPSAEIRTGEMWYDGATWKPVYRNFFSAATLASGDTTLIAAGSGITKILREWGHGTNGTSGRQVHMGFNDGTNKIFSWLDTQAPNAGRLGITGAGVVTGASTPWQLTVEYIK